MALLVCACLAVMASTVHGAASTRRPAGTAHVTVTQGALETTAPATAHPVTTVGSTPESTPTRTTKPGGPDLRSVPFAYAAGVALYHPSAFVDRIGFHQASDRRDLLLRTAPHAMHPRVMHSRGRGTGARTAADIVVPANTTIYAPVSGIVKRAMGYHLYCKYIDNFVVISPVHHPELEVKILHVTGLLVHPGSKVVAGKTAIAAHATKFPFVSEVDVSTPHHQPHVHIEVTPLAVPSAKPQPGKGLTFGCG